MADAKTELDMRWFSSQFVAAARAVQPPKRNFWRNRLDEVTLHHGLMLRENTDRYLAIFDTEVDAIVVTDRFGTIQSFNRAAESIFGYSKGEIVGQNVRSLMAE